MARPQPRQSSQPIDHPTGLSLRIWLLGAFRISVEGRSVEAAGWRLRKAGSLLKLLAITAGHRLHKEQVAEMLWPGMDGRAAANNVHQVLHFARHTLQPNLPPRAAPDYLSLREEMINLGPPDEVWVDVDAFEAAAEVARRRSTVEGYESALALYRGDLLPDDPYEDWAATRREALRNTYHSLLLDLSHAQQAGGDISAARTTLERVLTLDALHEEAHMGLMRLLAVSGHRAEALRQYERLRESLQHELAVDPQPATRRLYEEILEGVPLKAQPEPPPSMRPAPGSRRRVGSRPRPQPEQPVASQTPEHNLPVQLSSFVGRTKEVAEVVQVISDARLVTLAGPGGCGKTRLALRVAGELASGYPDGAWIVDLAALTDEALVTRTVAGVLGVREERGRTLRETLTRSVAQKKFLLVLDNCEHLVGACADLAAALLAGSAGIRILATSRQPLMVAGEVTWRVPSLWLPGEPVPSADDAQNYDAVRLFVERAQLARPGFALTDENVPSVVSLCRRLDGLPLAIELAAARINVLSPRQILERLQDPFQVLGEGPYSAPDRQQTLRAAMDWSYRLLGALEQRLFDRLSVFRGSCSLEAAEAIVVGDGIGAGDVLPLLAHLVERSMVVVEEAEDSSVRYRLLETLREYGWQHLAASAAREDLRQRHATYFLELALEADQSFRGPDQGRWLDRLELDHDNLRAALDWWADRDVETALRLAAALGAFWLIRAYVSEGRARLSHLLSKSTPAGTARALAMANFGSLARRQGDYAEARAHLEAALEVFRETADRLGSARTLKELGAVAWHQGDLPLAWPLLEQALALFRQLGDKPGMAGALNDLAVVIDLQGDDAKAEDLYKEALALYRGLGDDSGAATILMNLGTLANELGDNAGACRYYEESAGICRRLANREKLANVLGNFANALRDLGDLAAARQAYLESLELNRRGGDRRGVAYVLAGLGQMARDEGRFAEAMRFYREATEIRIGLGEKVELAKSIEAFAMLAFARDDASRGVRLAAAAAGLRRHLGAPLEPVFRTVVEEQLQQARETLGSVTYDAIWQEAEGIGVEEALAFAMAENQE